jgi:hypothetical protein
LERRRGMEIEMSQSMVASNGFKYFILPQTSLAKEAKNTVQEIQMRAGLVLDNFDHTKEAATQHFGYLYTQERIEGEENSEQVIVENITTCITEEENNFIIREINEEEIYQALWGLDQDKDLGHDGFSTHFFTLFWDIVKFDMKRMLKYTLRKKKVGGATNSTF